MHKFLDRPESSCLEPRKNPLYAMRQVLGLAILMFACRLASLRGLDRVPDDARFPPDRCAFTRAKTDTVLCSRQMTNVPARMDREELGRMRVQAIKDGPGKSRDELYKGLIHRTTGISRSPG